MAERHGEWFMENEVGAWTATSTHRGRLKSQGLGGAASIHRAPPRNQGRSEVGALRNEKRASRPRLVVRRLEIRDGASSRQRQDEYYRLHGAPSLRSTPPACAAPSPLQHRASPPRAPPGCRSALSASSSPVPAPLLLSAVA